MSTFASTKLEPAQTNLPQQQQSEKAPFQVETRWEIGLMTFVWQGETLLVVLRWIHYELERNEERSSIFNGQGSRCFFGLHKALANENYFPRHHRENENAQQCSKMKNCLLFFLCFGGGKWRKKWIGEERSWESCCMIYFSLRTKTNLNFCFFYSNIKLSAICKFFASFVSANGTFTTLRALLESPVEIWRATSINLTFSHSPASVDNEISFKLFQLIYRLHFVIKLRNTKKRIRSIKLAVDVLSFFRRIFLASSAKFSVCQKIDLFTFSALFHRARERWEELGDDDWEVCYCSGMSADIWQRPRFCFLFVIKICNCSALNVVAF